MYERDRSQSQSNPREQNIKHSRVTEPPPPPSAAPLTSAAEGLAPAFGQLPFQQSPVAGPHPLHHGQPHYYSYGAGQAPHAVASPPLYYSTPATPLTPPPPAPLLGYRSPTVGVASPSLGYGGGDPRLQGPSYQPSSAASVPASAHAAASSSAGSSSAASSQPSPDRLVSVHPPYLPSPSSSSSSSSGSSASPARAVPISDSRVVFQSSIRAIFQAISDGNGYQTIEAQNLRRLTTKGSEEIKELEKLEAKHKLSAAGKVRVKSLQRSLMSLAEHKANCDRIILPHLEAALDDLHHHSELVGDKAKLAHVNPEFERILQEITALLRDEKSFPVVSDDESDRILTREQIARHLTIGLLRSACSAFDNEEINPEKTVARARVVVGDRQLGIGVVVGHQKIRLDLASRLVKLWGQSKFGPHSPTPVTPPIPIERRGAASGQYYRGPDMGHAVLIDKGPQPPRRGDSAEVDLGFAAAAVLAGGHAHAQAHGRGHPDGDEQKLMQAIARVAFNGGDRPHARHRAPSDQGVAAAALAQHHIAGGLGRAHATPTPASGTPGAAADGSHADPAVRSLSTPPLGLGGGMGFSPGSR